MNACNKITRMWNIAQAAPAITWPTKPKMDRSTPKVQTLPKRAINIKINSPAYIFPNNRIPKDTVFATYSIKFKNKLKQMVETNKNIYLGDLDTANATIVKDEIPLIQLIDQINYVVDGTDGYVNKMGSVVVYGITGTSKINASSVGVSNTFNELKQDFTKINTDLNELNNKLENEILSNSTTRKYNENFTYDVGLKVSSPSGTTEYDNRCFIVFGNEILKDPVKFITTVTEPFINTTNDIKAQTFISKNVGWIYSLNLTTGTFKNEPLPTGLYTDYKKSKETTDVYWKTFKDDFYTNKYTTYNPYNLDKKREFTYSKIL